MQHIFRESAVHLYLTKSLFLSVQVLLILSLEGNNEKEKCTYANYLQVKLISIVININAS